jgi:uncharacterized protein YqiB (DUF1249 family)
MEHLRRVWEENYRRLDALLAELQPEKRPGFKPDNN